VALIEIDDCVFDREQYDLSHGLEALDPVGRGAFVNHLHLSGQNASLEADRIIQSWIREMRLRWPGRTFRIYRQVESSEITIRFHLVRPGLPNWCEQDIEITTVPG